MNEPLTIKLRTLTPLWTGGVDQKCDRLHETGLLGSLRWWYEALVRGFGGDACDPTEDGRCPDDAGKRCVACALFGCTGWSRKFRLQIIDTKDKPIEAALLGSNAEFALRFLELHPLGGEERWLLAKAVEIAAKYGAVGGKTTLKPQKRPKVGEDYGIVQGQEIRWLQKPDIRIFVNKNIWRHVQVKEPDLRCFFFISGAFLWCRQINTLIGLSEDGRSVVGRESYQEFLRGRRGTSGDPAVSKKIFSFRAGGGRVWGYAGDGEMRDTIIDKVKELLGKGAYRIKTGEEIVSEL